MLVDVGLLLTTAGKHVGAAAHHRRRFGRRGHVPDVQSRREAQRADAEVGRGLPRREVQEEVRRAEEQTTRGATPGASWTYAAPHLPLDLWGSRRGVQGHGSTWARAWGRLPRPARGGIDAAPLLSRRRVLPPHADFSPPRDGTLALSSSSSTPEGATSSWDTRVDGADHRTDGM